MRRFILLAMVAGMALTTLARPALAASRTPFIATISDVSEEGGTFECFYHGECFLRDLSQQWVLTGDFEGTYVDIANANFLRKAYVWGTFVITTSDVTYEGTFQGVDPTGVGTSFSGSLVAHGSDGTDLIDSTFTSIEGGAEYLLQGTILDPNG